MRRTKRVLRRHHRERLKNKRKKYWGYETDFNPEKMDERTLGMIARTATPCSCWQCKNPRRVFKGKDKLTIQERK